MKIKNKYLIVLFFVIFAFIILSVSNNVSASSTKTFTYNNKTYEFPTDNFLDYSVIIYWYTDNDGNCVFMAFSSNKAFYCKNVDVVGENILHVPADTSFNKIILKYDNENTDVSSPSVTVVNKSSRGSEAYLSTETNLGALRVSQLQERSVYCSHDILNVEGNVVFQKPVLTLGEVLEQTNPVQTFQTMTRGIITYLIVFLVGLVAFWKAWQLLSKELRKG